MAKKLTSARGQVSNVKTFHADGSPEIRLTVLAGKKRIDVHLFDTDNPSLANLPLGRFLALAGSSQVSDGHKIEIGPGNLSDFEELGAKTPAPGQGGAGSGSAGQPGSRTPAPAPGQGTGTDAGSAA